ncbi:MAG: VOC family protein [archaeon]|jgi:group I intron endonuclease
MDNIIKSGIYKILNIVNGKQYVGSAVNLEKRKKEHFYALKKQKHINTYLQRSFDKYGEDNLKFEVIEYIEDKNNLIEKEQYWMDKLNCVSPNGYNICPTAGNTLGVKCTEETKSKIKESSKGGNHPSLNKHMTQEIKQKLSKINKGKKVSEDTKEKLKEKNKHVKSGENNWCSKLTDNDVIEIKRIFKNKEMNCADIAKKYNIGKTAIYDIKNNKTWKYIDENGNIDYNIKNKTLTKDNVIEIKKMLNENISNNEIAKNFNISNTTISDIDTGKYWKNIIVNNEYKIRHIGIVTKNLQKIINFYKLFGFKVYTYKEYNKDSLRNIIGINESDRIETYKLFDGSTIIEVLYYSNYSDKKINKNLWDLGYSHIAFTIDNLDEFYNKLIDNGVEFISAPQLSSFDNVKLCFCKDPDGNFIELVQDLPALEEQI